MNRIALRALHDAEVDVLMAAQRAARRQAVRAVDAALSARHGTAIAFVVARFADRRAAANSMDRAGRDGVLRQIAAEEAQELARLALEHAAERRALRSATLLELITVQRAERRTARRRNRWQRMVSAVLLQPASVTFSSAKSRAVLHSVRGRNAGRFTMRNQ